MFTYRRSKTLLLTPRFEIPGVRRGGAPSARGDARGDARGTRGDAPRALGDARGDALCARGDARLEF